MSFRLVYGGLCQGVSFFIITSSVSYASRILDAVDDARNAHIFLSLSNVLFTFLLRVRSSFFYPLELHISSFGFVNLLSFLASIIAY